MNIKTQLSLFLPILDEEVLYECFTELLKRNSLETLEEMHSDIAEALNENKNGL